MCLMVILLGKYKGEPLNQISELHSLISPHCFESAITALWGNTIFLYQLIHNHLGINFSECFTMSPVTSYYHRGHTVESLLSAYYLLSAYAFLVIDHG